MFHQVQFQVAVVVVLEEPNQLVQHMEYFKHQIQILVLDLFYAIMVLLDHTIAVKELILTLKEVYA